MSTIGRGGIEALLGLMDEAFDGAGIEDTDESQALMTNLATVTDDQWRARPDGVTRTIESIALHVGACKVMYDDYAFGAGHAAVRIAGGRAMDGRGSRADDGRPRLAARGPGEAAGPRS